MLELAYFTLTVLALLIAAYTDLKERIVSNKLTFGLGAAGLVLKGAESFFANSPQPMFLSLAGGAIAFILCYVLWQIGVWASGDVKLVSAIAILNPVNYAALASIFPVTNPLFSSIGLPVFSATLIIYSVFATLPLGAAMVFSAGLKHKEALARAAKKISGKALGIALFSATISALKVILDSYPSAAIDGTLPSELAIIPLLVILAFLPGKIRAVVSVIVVGAGLYFEPLGFFLKAVLVAAPIMALYALWKIYDESREYAFTEMVSSRALREGMIPSRYIVEKNGRIELVEAPSMARVLKDLISNRMKSGLRLLRLDGNVISSPLSAGGLSAEDAQELRKKAQSGIMPNKISVKKTMAFVPAILVAYIAAQFTGDLIWNILF